MKTVRDLGGTASMAMPLTFRAIFLTVTLGALAGMVLGGLFGLGAGALAPGLFRTLCPWTSLEPLGTAAVLGAMAGILLGGGLAVFAITVQLAGQFLESRNPRKG